ncbi:MAG: DUF58 domain-containing protein [Lachnospiraceae bacterium]|nr:DUF58 domain-containing protein [Lachnospiraceae bacterium]
MKHYVFVILLFLTWYIAGLYNSEILIGLFVLDICIFIVLTVIVIYFKMALSINFKSDTESVVRNEISTIKLETNNKSFVTIPRISIRLRMSYLLNGKYIFTKEHTNEHRLMLSATPGTQLLDIKFTPKFSGILNMRSGRFLVYDFISLYSVWKKNRISKNIVVVPDEKHLKIRLDNMYSSNNQAENDCLSDKSGNSTEFDQVREYEYGDLYKNIHWKLSSKSDELMIKTYKNEANNSCGLVIQNDNFESIEQASAFYELVYSTILGLLDLYDYIYLRYNCDKANIDLRITSKTDADNLILAIITNNFSSYTDSESLDDSIEHSYSINSNLELKLNEDIIHKFSVDTIDDEINTVELNIANGDR